ncbi:B12-binding domain-containing radical SAM protein [Candidatus Aerophobetes bacterium]|nr:B12-binding domain-containing radical SAM protein [Candidatus Aerophobetes bacterium]
MKILLVDPPCTSRVWEPHSEHLGIGYLASELREEGFDAEIMDAGLLRWSPTRTCREILKRKPDILGISVVQPAVKNTFFIVKFLREKGLKSHICLGGHFVTLKTEAVLQNFPSVDSVVYGEGDITFPLLVKKISNNEDWKCIEGIGYREEGRVVINPPRPLVENLDGLPFPARDTLPLVLRWGRNPIVITSKGCYGKCIFCGPRAFYEKSPGRKWRGRSAENVLEELEYLYKKWEVEVVDFLDDNFFGPGEKGKKRAEDIAKGLIKRKIPVKFSIECRVDNVERELFSLLKKAGLYEVRLGVESGVQKILDRYGKGVTVEDNKKAVKTLKELGIDCKIGFIPADPWMNFEEFLENGQFLRELGSPSAFNITRLSVVAGTPLEEILRKEGKLIEKSFYEFDYYFSDKKVKFLYSVYRTIQVIQNLYHRFISRIDIALRDLKYYLGKVRLNLPIPFSDQ